MKHSAHDPSSSLWQLQLQLKKIQKDKKRRNEDLPAGKPQLWVCIFICGSHCDWSQRWSYLYVCKGRNQLPVCKQLPVGQFANLAEIAHSNKLYALSVIEKYWDIMMSDNRATLWERKRRRNRERGWERPVQLDIARIWVPFPNPNINSNSNYKWFENETCAVSWPFPEPRAPSPKPPQCPIPNSYTPFLVGGRRGKQKKKSPFDFIS